MENYIHIYIHALHTCIYECVGIYIKDTGYKPAYNLWSQCLYMNVYLSTSISKIYVETITNVFTNILIMVFP